MTLRSFRADANRFSPPCGRSLRMGSQGRHLARPSSIVHLALSASFSIRSYGRAGLLATTSPAFCAICFAFADYFFSVANLHATPSLLLLLRFFLLFYLPAYRQLPGSYAASICSL